MALLMRSSVSVSVAGFSLPLYLSSAHREAVLKETGLKERKAGSSDRKYSKCSDCDLV